MGYERRGAVRLDQRVDLSECFRSSADVEDAPSLPVGGDVLRVSPAADEGSAGGAQPHRHHILTRGGIQLDPVFVGRGVQFVSGSRGKLVAETNQFHTFSGSTID